jgi:aspartate aminotransferase
MLARTMIEQEDPQTPFRRLFTQMSPNISGELLRYGKSKPGILCLGQGEGERTTPSFIIDAASDALDAGKTFYAPVLGVPELRQEIANYYSRIYGLNIPTSRIFATTSGTNAVNLALTSILSAGDEVVAVTPIWRNLIGSIEMTGATVRQVSMDYTSARGWTLDLDRLFAAVTPETRCLLLVSPSNPAGTVLSSDDIAAIMEFARSRDLWVISDEVYGRLAYNMTRAPSFLDHANGDDRLFVVNSFSKTYAMTGWRLGWLVGPSYAENVIRDISLYETMGPPAFIQFAGISALRNGEAFLAEQKEGWVENAKILRKFAEDHPKIEISLPPAAFYAMLRVEGEPDCVSLTRRLIDEALLNLAPGCSFGACSSSWLRMCFAVSQDKLEDALSRLATIL